MTDTRNTRPRRIQAILMDQFGTLTDQHGSMTRLLTAEASAVGCGAGAPAMPFSCVEGTEGGREPTNSFRDDTGLQGIDWSAFAEQWRAGYLRRT